LAKLYVLSATGDTLPATAGQRFADVVASFHDDEPGMVALNYTALVDWGDGSPLSTGGVSANADGTWDVAASHTYVDPGSYPVTVTIFDTHPGGMTATATSTAEVTAPGALPSGGGGAEFTGLAAALQSVSSLRLNPERPVGGGQGSAYQAADGAGFHALVSLLSAQAPVPTLLARDVGAFPSSNNFSPGHRLTHAEPLESLGQWNPAVLDLLAANLLPVS
jgi:hypothetical protein